MQSADDELNAVYLFTNRGCGTSAVFLMLTINTSKTAAALIMWKCRLKTVVRIGDSGACAL